MNTSSILYKAQRILKRAIDLIISTLGLLFLWPFFLVISLLIKRDSPGDAIYRHRRIGKDGRPFDMYKFRSMVIGNNDSQYKDYLLRLIESGKNGRSGGLPYRKLEGDPRITRVGKILRRYYLDELPQLINVIKGEMSLVGPRPHVELEVNQYNQVQRRRLTVRPGLTGLWQVEGKMNCSFHELIQLDLDYIDYWNLWLDIKIIMETIIAMVGGGEISFKRKGGVEQQPINITIHEPESSSIDRS